MTNLGKISHTKRKPQEICLSVRKQLTENKRNTIN